LSSSNPPSPAVVLKKGRDAPVRKRRHPWIYSQAIAEAPVGSSPSDLHPVATSDGNVIGWGLYSPESLIAVRMVSYGAERPADDWIGTRIRESLDLRRSLSLDTDAVRLVNSEGDFLPGLVIDRYADTVVVCPHTRGIEASLDRVVESLARELPETRVYVKRDEHSARVEKLSLASGYARGTGEGITTIREGAIRVLVDFAHGQKTGYYLDQRANRGLIAQCSRGKSVLNLFSYTGAASLRAAAAGAVRVTSVDSSERALEMAERSVGLTEGLGPGLFEWIRADVFDYLQEDASYDIVVADPPPFARRRVELEGAIKGYTSLFQQSLRRVSPGGLAFLFSCSGAVDRPLFQQIVAEAALRAGRPARLLRELHADMDHPVAATHPEGEYLKGWVVHVA
jgi:23S rRNA (cytosine1962-C5)-methyltransferase